MRIYTKVILPIILYWANPKSIQHQSIKVVSNLLFPQLRVISGTKPRLYCSLLAGQQQYQFFFPMEMHSAHVTEMDGDFISTFSNINKIIFILDLRIEASNDYISTLFHMRLFVISDLLLQVLTAAVEHHWQNALYISNAYKQNRLSQSTESTTMYTKMYGALEQYLHTLTYQRSTQQYSPSICCIFCVNEARYESNILYYIILSKIIFKNRNPKII